MITSLKRIFIDTETTGREETSGIWSLAAIVDINGVEHARREWSIRPDPRCTIDLEALQVGNITTEVMDAFMPEAEFYRQFVRWLGTFVNKFDKHDKLWFTAFHAGFDSERLRDLFKRQGDVYYGSWFWHPYDCVMIRAGQKLVNIRHTMPDFKLGTVCRIAGIDFNPMQAHGAMYDIDRTRALHYKLEGATALP